MRVFFNPYNLQEVWITSFGNGMKHGIDQTITVIPVELVSFSGKKINHVNVFNWETLSESNTLNFELQRLNKDNNFETIATLKAQNKAAKYSFTDDLTVEKTSATLINSIDYYRLKINDLDGKTTFSKTIGLENDKILRGIKSQFQVNFSNFNIN